MFVLDVEHVADLHAESQRGLPDVVGVGEFHIDVVIRLEDVLGVCLAPHPFAHIEVRRRELQSAPANYSREARRECRRVAYRLVVHVFIRRVGAIDVPLPRDGREQREVPLLRHVVPLECRVQSAAEGLAVVHHRPGVGALKRQADYAVLYLVAINVGLRIESPTTTIDRCPSSVVLLTSPIIHLTSSIIHLTSPVAPMIFHAEVQLLRVLGLQVAVAHLRVVKVVECRRAEDFLVPAAHGQAAERVGERHRGRPHVYRVGGSCLHKRPVAVTLVQGRRCCLNAFPTRLRRKDKLLVHALHVLEALQVGLHDAVSDVVARRERQPAPRHESSAKGSVSVLLTVVIIHASRVLILRILRVVAQILVRILGVRLVAKPLEGLLLIARLHEEVAVPLPAYVRVLVRQAPHDAARAAALGVVIIDVRREAATEQGSLHATVADVAVRAASHGVFVFGMIAEGIVASARAVLAIDEALPASPRELSVHLCHPGKERGVAELHGERVVRGPLGLQIDRRTRGVLAGRLAVVELVGVIERHGFHGGERELAKVNGAVLRVRQADTIDVNAHMLGAERTDVDGLQSAQTAVVLNLHARKVLQGIGHRRRTQGLQVSTAQCLRRRNRANRHLRRHRHLVQLTNGIIRQQSVSSRLSPVARRLWTLRIGTCCHSKCQYGSQNRLQIVFY